MYTVDDFMCLLYTGSIYIFGKKKNCQRKLFGCELATKYKIVFYYPIFVVNTTLIIRLELDRRKRHFYHGETIFAKIKDCHDEVIEMICRRKKTFSKILNKSLN